MQTNASGAPCPSGSLGRSASSQRAVSEHPHFEKTEAGDQAVITGAEGRSIPDAKLKPRKRQRDTLTPLEAGEADSKQQSLF